MKQLHPDAQYVPSHKSELESKFIHKDINLKEQIIRIKKPKLNALIEQIINEGASDILYHFTHSSKLSNILRTNELSLTSAIGSKSDLDINKDKYFFFSMTRSKNTGYVRGDVKLVINAKKLKQNYKIIPVDYWQYPKNIDAWPDKNSYIQSLKSSEQEDRLISNNSTIPNFTKYILEIHMLINDNKLNSLIVNLANKYNIDIFIYNNRKDWLNQTNNINQTQLIQIDNSSNEYDYNDYNQNFNNNFYPIAALISYNDQENYIKIKNYLQDQNKIDYLDKIIHDDTINYFKINANYDYDLIPVFSNHIHNIRANPDNHSRFILQILSNSLRKFKTKNISEYIKKKQWLNKKTIDDYKNEIYQYINNILYDNLLNYLDDYLKDWIEIDGNYFNHAYDADQIQTFIYNHLSQLLNIIKNTINNNDIFKYTYLLNSVYLKQHFTLNKITEHINITDLSFYYEDGELNEKINRIFFYLIHDVDDIAYKKIKQSYENYLKQF